MKKIFFSVLLSILCLATTAQQKAEVVIKTTQGKDKISKHIYGHFAEHLGRGIYGGLWVGENSPIPNTNGVRNDVIAALKAIKIPNLRWPGGCFADEYHWRDGIGPRAKRPKMINTNWGGVVEDNSFGTHEFLNLCEVLGTEPYICGNVGSGTVEEMSKWVEYITFDGQSPMAELRKQNGREKPWNVKLWGVGNENWGCGGQMTADYYADNYNRFAIFCKNYGSNHLMKIAGGANSYDVNWTEVLMKKVPHWLMYGVSLHNYTFGISWEKKVPATGFTENDYFTILEDGNKMDDLITKHSAAMDKYDPQKKIALVVDEWGAWYNSEPGTNPGFLYQQNSLRDALLAGNILNIFHKHCDRVKVANIAQMVNVLQAIILTKDDQMILTPTYHVFNMYKVHQDATLLPLDLKTPQYSFNGRNIAAVSATASKDNSGAIHISLVNIDPKNEIELSCALDGLTTGKITDSNILTGKDIQSHNTFEQPYNVKPEAFKGASLKNGRLALKLPAKSLVTIEIR